jgi:uncharacterized SAM-binding protein YcdF (DUF218 family)
MFVFLSKLLPQLFYPLGLSCLLLLLALLLRRHKGWRNTLLIIALGILWLAGNRWVAIPLARSLEWQYLPAKEIPQTDVIVVLGGATESKDYPRPTVEVNSAGDRVLYAARLYKEGKAAHLLLSGGSIDWLETRSTSPAAEMADILELADIPKDALWLDNQSRNTYENALYSRQILEPKGIKRILLVTSAMHMPRAVALFKHQGFDVVPAPTDFTVTDSVWQDLTHGDIAGQIVNFFPSSSSLSLTTNVIKEYLGMLIYRLRGWM